MADMGCVENLVVQLQVHSRVWLVCEEVAYKMQC